MLFLCPHKATVSCLSVSCKGFSGGEAEVGKVLGPRYTSIFLFESKEARKDGRKGWVGRVESQREGRREEGIDSFKLDARVLKLQESTVTCQQCNNCSFNMLAVL